MGSDIATLEMELHSVELSVQSYVYRETGLILFMSPMCAISRNNHAHKWPVKCLEPQPSERRREREIGRGAKEPDQLHFIFHFKCYLQNMCEIALPCSAMQIKN